MVSRTTLDSFGYRRGALNAAIAATFQNFSVLSFGAIVPPSSLHFAYEAGADECSIWGIIAAASHTVVDVMPRIMRYELRDYEWTAKARINPNWAACQ
jgi:hypothetical protein